jgi:uncharacterized cupredoxin-like copper-binding protein
MLRFKIGVISLVVATGALVSALPALAAPGAAKATTIVVTAGKPSEYKFKLSKLSAPKGVVNFKVTNVGIVPHDFKILGKKTRVLSPGKAQTISVTFKTAKKYPFLCAVTGHAAAGMKGTFTIK